MNNDCKTSLFKDYRIPGYDSLVIYKCNSILPKAMTTNDSVLISEKLAVASQLYQTGEVTRSAAICGGILKVQPDNVDGLYLLGLISHRVGNNEMALDMLSRAITANPDNPDYYYNCGVVCDALGLSEDAVRCYCQAIHLKPDHLDALMNLGDLNLKQGDFTSAVGCYQLALNLDSNNIKAVRNMAVALQVSVLDQSQNNVSSILPNLDIPTDSIPTSTRSQAVPTRTRRKKEKIAALQVPAAINLAVAHQKVGQLDDAEKIYRQVLRSYPTNSDALHLLGLIAHQRGDNETAVVLITKASEISPLISFIHNNLGMAWHDLGKIDQAISCYRRAIHLEASYIEPWLNLGTAYQDQENLSEAISCFRHVLKHVPDSAKAHNNLGRSLCDQGELEQGLEHLRKAIEIDPANASAFGNIGIILCKQQKNSEAKFYLERAVSLDPDNAEFHNNIGVACKKTTEAIKHFEKAIALRPDCAKFYCNLGAELCEQSDYQGAAPILKEALRLDPHSAKNHNNLGIALNNLDKPHEAIDHFERAITLESEDPTHYLNMGTSYRLISRLDEAIIYYQRALSLKPDYSDAMNNLAAVLLEKGNPLEAIELYENALELSPDNDLLRQNLGFALLETGSLERGWRGFGYRWQSVKKGHMRPFNQPWWDGSDLTDKTILVWGEQGIGDEILYANTFPDVVAASGHCIIECEPRLIPLFSRSFPQAEIIARTDTCNIRTLQPDIDWQIPAGNLFQWFRPTIEHFPRLPFLQADPERVNFWKQRVTSAGNGLKVGIIWRSMIRSNDRDRSYTELMQWGPILTIPDITFINLQYDDCHTEIEEANQHFGVEIHEWNDIDLMNDLDAAAALTLACDLVISPATSVCMMSGALGVPTWRLTTTQDYTLLGESNSSPFFSCMKPFQSSPDMGWDEVITIVAAELRSFVSFGRTDS